MSRRLRITALVGALALSSPPMAQEDVVRSSWTLNLENDLFAPSQDDNAYTGGLALSIGGAQSRRLPVSLDKPLGAINGLLPIDGLQKGRGRRLQNLEIGVATFTPRETELKEPLPDQHPYACLGFLNSNRIDVQPGEDSAYLSSLTLGLLGTRLCEELQTGIHDALGIDGAEGWEHQISDGGELTARWTLSRQDLVKASGADFQRTDVSSFVDTALGFTTSIGAGLNWRWGRIKSPWWSSTPQHAEYISLGDMRPVVREGEWYIFAGVRGQYRLYNALLQGQFRESEVTFSRDELDDFVLEGWGGISAAFSASTTLTLTLRSRSSELRHQPSSSWGSISIRYEY